MWLQHPFNREVVQNLNERSVVDSAMIQQFLAEGYVQVQPAWMRSPAGDVFLIEPWHQARVYAQGFVPCDAPNATSAVEETAAPKAPPVLSPRKK